jgi:hypothetical protein
MSKIAVTIDRTVNTYAYLAHGASIALTEAEKEGGGSFFHNMNAILLSAFTLEAYYNHLGENCFNLWASTDRISNYKKLEIILEHFGLEPDLESTPFSEIRELFEFRNEIAHGRTEVLGPVQMVHEDEGRGLNEYAPKSHWEEYCSLDSAKASRDNVENIANLLAEAVGHFPQPFKDFGSGNAVSGPA